MRSKRVLTLWIVLLTLILIGFFQALFTYRPTIQSVVDQISVDENNNSTANNKNSQNTSRNSADDVVNNPRNSSSKETNHDTPNQSNENTSVDTTIPSATEINAKPDLNKIYSLNGIVVDEANDLPVPGVQLMILSGKNGEHKVGEFVTDSDGKFEITSIPDGEYRLNVEKTGYWITGQRDDYSGVVPFVWPFEVNKNIHDYRVRIKKTGGFTGRIFSPDNTHVNENYLKLLLWYHTSSNKSAPAIGYETYVRADGSFFVEVDNGVYFDDGYKISETKVEITVYHPTHPSITIETDMPYQGQIVDLGELRFENSFTFSGRVKNKHGKPIYRAQIQAVFLAYRIDSKIKSAENSWSDRLGKFQVSSIKAGHCILKISHPKYIPQAFELNVNKDMEKDFILEEGESISGQIFTAGNKPLDRDIHRIYVYTLLDINGEQVRQSVKVDKDGKYELHGLQPFMDIKIQVSDGHTYGKYYFPDKSDSYKIVNVGSTDVNFIISERIKVPLKVIDDFTDLELYTIDRGRFIIKVSQLSINDENEETMYHMPYHRDRCLYLIPGNYTFTISCIDSQKEFFYKQYKIEITSPKSPPDNTLDSFEVRLKRVIK